jgi:hypothetical protein
MLARVINLRDLGVRTHLFSKEADDLGFCHVPWPLSLADLVALEEATYRVVDFVYLEDCAIDVIAIVEPVRLELTG